MESDQRILFRHPLKCHKTVKIVQSNYALRILHLSTSALHGDQHDTETGTPIVSVTLKPALNVDTRAKLDTEGGGQLSNYYDFAYSKLLAWIKL